MRPELVTLAMFGMVPVAMILGAPLSFAMGGAAITFGCGTMTPLKWRPDPAISNAARARASNLAIPPLKPSLE